VIEKFVHSETEDDTRRDTEGSELYARRYDESSDEDDDSEDSTSGIFARLKGVARKYGPSCGVV